MPSVWEEVEKLRPLCPTQQRRERRILGSHVIEQVFHWVTHIDYHSHPLQWLECIETIDPHVGAEQSNHRFVHLTNLDVTAKTVCVLSATGRMRWKIENEGFNTQKNGSLGIPVVLKFLKNNQLNSLSEKTMVPCTHPPTAQLLDSLCV